MIQISIGSVVMVLWLEYLPVTREVGVQILKRYHISFFSQNIILGVKQFIIIVSV